MTPPVTFERRRYGNTVYTWAYIRIDGEKISLGDPWPMRTVPKKELADALAHALATHQQKETPHE